MMINRFIYFFLFAMLLTACEDSPSRKITLPGNTGTPNEILLVAPDQIWKLSAGDVFKELTSKIQFGLPQDELMFQTVEVKESGFNDFWLTHRNIIKIEVDKSKKEGISVKREVYSRQQLYTVINLHSFDNLRKVLEPKAEQLLDVYLTEERKRLISRNKYFGSKELNQKVADITALDMVIQDEFFIAKEADNFLWLRLEREKPIGGYQHQISQGMIIYWRPYTDTAQFSDSSLLAWKAEVNRKYIEGPSESVMTISERMIMPRSEFINFNDLTTKEFRGLWRMEGYIMGGPFYSLAFYNPENGRQYMVEGYVYAPQFDKLKFLREIEAMCHSVSVIKKSEDS